MSSSYRKDRFVGLTIHKAPPHLSREEFKASMEANLADWLAVPVVKNNIIKSELVRIFG